MFGDRSVHGLIAYSMVFFKVKRNPILQKTSDKQKYTRMIFGIAYYITIQRADRKRYDEVENNRSPTYTNVSCSTRYTIAYAKLSNKQTTKSDL